ncbi:MAG: hypothetical protein MRJ65_13595 [Candidatus Brocadiaceae bacterium]|nr:hypothetical protein [Candidatus Brocadiaceae bacterium]
MKSDGTVWVCGENLGDPLAQRRTYPEISATPTKIHNLKNIVAIASGWEHNLALKSDGTVWAWGNNHFGQLGNGNVTEGSAPVQTQKLSNITDITAGFYHSIALKSDGTVWVWGNNETGQLGNGNTENNSIPMHLQGLHDIIAIASGNHHNLALQKDGTVWAWGANGYGQLGNGKMEDFSTLVAVEGISNITAIAAGNNHSFALHSDGTVWAWGYNKYGQLGSGTTSNSSIPLQIIDLKSVIAISAGGYHGIALQSDGVVQAFGYNRSGQLGNGTTSNYHYTTVKVRGLQDIKTISSGHNHCLALKSDGSVWAWGNNEFGQLGDGTKISRKVPVKAKITVDISEKVVQSSEKTTISDSSIISEIATVSETTAASDAIPVSTIATTAKTKTAALPPSISVGNTSVPFWQPSTPEEKAIQEAVNSFWKSVQRNEWQGILRLFSPQALEQHYNATINGLQPTLKFPIRELESYKGTVADPEQQRMLDFAILYKQEEFDILQFETNKLAAERVLSQFRDKSIRRFVIRDMLVYGNNVDVKGSLFFNDQRSGIEKEQKITQRLKLTDGRWLFGIDQ